MLSGNEVCPGIGPLLARGTCAPEQNRTNAGLRDPPRFSADFAVFIGLLTQFTARVVLMNLQRKLRWMVAESERSRAADRLGAPSKPIRAALEQLERSERCTRY